MSRIQTPNVTVNPNVEMVNREAPAIVYEPEPYVPETYFDYEQLTNVLEAGVKASQTFLDIRLLDKELEEKALLQSIKQRNDQFRVGFYEAERKDRESKVDGKTQYSYRKAYLESWKSDLGSLGAEEQKIYNDAYGDMAESSVEEAYKFNSNLIVSNVRGAVSNVTGLADGGDLVMMGVLANIDTQEKALAFIKGQIPKADLARLNSMTAYDRNQVESDVAEILSSLIARGQKIRAGRVASENKLKKEEAARATGITMAGNIMKPVATSVETGQPIVSVSSDEIREHLIKGIGEARAGILTVNPTAQASEIDTVINQTIDTTVQVVIESAPSSVLEATRAALMDPSVPMDARRKMELESRLNTAINNRMAEEVNMPMLMFEQTGDITGLELLKMDVLGNELYGKRTNEKGVKMAAVFVEKIEEAQKNVMRTQRNMAQGQIRDIAVEELRKRGRLSESDLLAYQLNLESVYKATRYVNAELPENPIISKLTGSELSIESPTSPDNVAIASAVDELRKLSDASASSGVQMAIDSLISSTEREIVENLRQEATPTAITVTNIVANINSRAAALGASEKDKDRFFAETGKFLRTKIFPLIDEKLLADVNDRLLKKYGVDDKGKPMLSVSALSGEITPSANTQNPARPSAEDVAYLRSQMLESMRFRWEWNGRTSDKTDINELRMRIVSLGTVDVMGKIPPAVIQALSLYREAKQYGITDEMMFGTDENGKRIAKVMSLAVQFDTGGTSAGALEGFRDAFLTVSNDPRFAGYDRISFGTQNNLTEVQTHIPKFMANNFDPAVPSDARMYGLYDFSRRVALKLQEGMEISTAMKEAEKEFVAGSVKVRGVSLPAADINDVLQGPTAAEAFLDYLTDGDEDVTLVWLDRDSMGRNLYGLRTKAGTTYVPKEKVIPYKDTDLGQDRQVIIPSKGVFTLEEMVPRGDTNTDRAVIFQQINNKIPAIVKKRSDLRLQEQNTAPYYQSTPMFR